MSLIHRFVGLVLIVVGVMIAGLCGTCTWSMLKGAQHITVSGLTMVMVLGGGPTLCGVACVIAGVSMLRRGPTSAPRRPPPSRPDE